MARVAQIATSSSNEETEVRGNRRSRTRQALIEAGERLIAKSSVSAVSVDEIVAEANVAKGTFYNHFVDKDELFNAIVEFVRGDLRSHIIEETKSLDDPGRKMARAYCLGLRYQLEHRDRVVFLTHSRLSARPIQSHLNVGVATYVAEGIARGRFHLATTETGILLMHGLNIAAYSQMVREPQPFAIIARAQQLTAVLLRGLGLSLQEADMIAAQEADFVLRVALSSPKLMEN